MLRVSQVALVVKNPLANAGNIRDMGLILGWKDHLEKGLATNSSILAMKIPWTEYPGSVQSQTGLKQLGTYTKDSITC